MTTILYANTVSLGSSPGIFFFKEQVGYQVRYRLEGREDTVRMDHDPGDRIPVRDGHLVLLADSRQ